MAGSLVKNIFDSKTFNNYKRVLMLPCAVPPSILLETAAVTAFEAYQSYLAPDFREYYHNVMGHSALCEVKQNLRAANLVRAEEESKATRVLFKLAEFVEIYRWYLFFDGLIANGLYDWTTGILEMNPCQEPSENRTHSGYAPFGASFDHGKWGTFDFNFDDPHHPAGPPGVVLAPGENCIVSASVQAMDLAGVPVGFDSRIYVSDTGEVLDAWTSTPRDPGPGYLTNHIWAQYHHGSSATGTTVVEWQCTYFGDLPDHELFPAFGTCYVAKW